MEKLPQGLKTRFAPSYGLPASRSCCLRNLCLGARAARGRDVLIRIEDHDQQRSRPEFTASIREDLHWLGFESSEPYVQQSQHFERYEQAVPKLSSHVYRCRCSRKEILERNPKASSAGELCYDGHCHALNEGPNLRVRMPDGDIAFDDFVLGPTRQNPALQCGDLLIQDREGQWTYNFAAAVDDVEEDIGLIIRGQDIFPSTARQIVLHRLLGRVESPYFVHHPLIWADSEKKLSKRDHSTSIEQWRKSGLSAGDILGRAAFLVGLQSVDRPLAQREITELFAIEPASKQETRP